MDEGGDRAGEVRVYVAQERFGVDAVRLPGRVRCPQSRAIGVRVRPDAETVVADQWAALELVEFRGGGQPVSGHAAGDLVDPGNEFDRIPCPHTSARISSRTVGRRHPLLAGEQPLDLLT